MMPTSTATRRPAAQERADIAGAGPSRAPYVGPAGDRTIADQTQPAATARPGIQADTTGNPGGVPARALPEAADVLAVIARPGQESADLGAMLHAFRRRGARLSLLCLTRGEASPPNSTCERLETIRPFELQVAAGLLGISSVTVADYPDGELRLALVPELAEQVWRAIRWQAPDLLLVVDPASSGNPDDAHAAQAACLAAESARLPVLARSLPDASSGWVIELGADAAAARAIQRCASGAHTSRSTARPQALRRLDLLGSQERMRWLILPHHTPGQRKTRQQVPPSPIGPSTRADPRPGRRGTRPGTRSPAPGQSPSVSLPV